MEHSAHLRQLSDEAVRIGTALSSLSEGAHFSEKTVGLTALAVPSSGVSLKRVRTVIRARRIRSKFFDGELFADPAWDILLALLQAELAQSRVSVSSLCIASAVPPTTALRWIKNLVDTGMLIRSADPHDGRRIFIELSSSTSEEMHRCFEAVDGALMI